MSATSKMILIKINILSKAHKVHQANKSFHKDKNKLYKQNLNNLKN